MKWNLPDKDLSLFVEFKQEGEFVIPDAHSLTLTLRNNSGGVITGYDGLVINTPYSSVATLTVLAAANEVTSGFFYETRYARFEFTVGGKPMVVEQTYRLVPFVPISATPADVRAVFGAREQELPDSDIDLVEAYISLQEDYPVEMGGALTGANTSRSANRAIVLQTAQMLFASMPNRILKEDGVNTALLVRDKTDWNALQATILSELGVVMGKLQSEAGAAGGTNPTPILVLAGPSVDPITNA